YNDLIDGSYLIWAAGEYPVFVDGRLEVYGEELLAGLLAVPRRRWTSSAEWNAEADLHGINTVVLNRQYHGSLITRLDRASDWVLVYLDARNLIFARRTPENEPVIDRYRIDPNERWTPRGPEEDLVPTGWRAWLGAVGRPTHSFEMAKTFLALSSAENAITYLERGLERFPDHREMRWTLAQVYHSLGRETAADNIMNEVRLSQEEEFRAARLLGNLLMMEEKMQEAVVPFERAVELRPDDPAALIDLGRAALAAEDYRVAADAYDRAVRLRPESPRLWVNLGMALQHSGNKTGAIAAYERAIVHDPNQFQVLNQVGMLYAERGDALRAERYFQRALQIRPDYAAARANLERLRSSR
ncbi:MAG: tetratricopeptide repeat protein, partial [Acidobacteriota bacterium]|nr:tetratricopeptide repeat protein [Acidobacteriota bacterium]